MVLFWYKCVGDAGVSDPGYVNVSRYNIGAGLDDKKEYGASLT